MSIRAKDTLTTAEGAQPVRARVSNGFFVNSWDVTTLAGVTAILWIAALLASFLPAHRGIGEPGRGATS